MTPSEPGYGGTGTPAQRLSVIVPTLNESLQLPGLIDRLRTQAPGVEIIVADGGSRDATCAVAEGLADGVIKTEAGRARQQNAAARRATRDILWFLHADCLPPDGFAEAIAGCIDAGAVGGCFQLRLPERDTILRVSDQLGNLAVDLVGVAYGDHGIFCTRQAFERTGGFPAQDLFEDADFYRALRRIGPVRQLRAKVQASSRRYRNYGPVRTTTAFLLLTALYALNLPRPALARLYQRFFKAG
jgi:rSAM/selenodomain-associated transferase 2